MRLLAVVLLSFSIFFDWAQLQAEDNPRPALLLANYYPLENEPPLLDKLTDIFQILNSSAFPFPEDEGLIVGVRPESHWSGHDFYVLASHFNFDAPLHENLLYEIYSRIPKTSRGVHSHRVVRVEAFAGKLEAEKAYEILGVKGLENNWAQGPTVFFLGQRLKTLTAERFTVRLEAHVNLVKKSFMDFGLKGYLVYSDGNVEMAMMNWESKEKMQEALASLKGTLVREEAATIMQSRVWVDVASHLKASYSQATILQKK